MDQFLCIYIELSHERLKKSWNVIVNVCVASSLYLHGSPLGKGDHKVLPLPVLLNHMGKDDMSVAAGPGQLGAVCRPGQAEHTACVGLLQCIGPLEGGEEGRKRTLWLMATDILSTILNNYLGGSLKTRNNEKFRDAWVKSRVWVSAYMCAHIM